MLNKLTPKDIERLRRKYLIMLLDEERMSEGGYDDVMTSIGYVALWTDGEVTTTHDGLLGRFDEDGDWTPNGDGEDAAEGEE